MRRWLSIVMVFLFLFGLAPLASAAPSTEELMRRIEQLTRELEALKSQLKEIKATQEEQSETVADVSDTIEEFKDNMGKFKIWGDIRARVDSASAHVPANKYMFSLLPTFTQFRVASGATLSGTDALGNPIDSNKYYFVSSGGHALVNLDPQLKERFTRAGQSHSQDNDTIYTNRMRINFKVNPTENTNVKVRLSYYKIWGMTNDYIAPGLFPPTTNNFTLGVRPADNALYVDRAYFNWVNVGGLPMWVSFGRRPTTHGVPSQLREGLDNREASPAGINIDVPFDGATIGFQYSWPWRGRIRFCYGRGFESGFKMPLDRAKDDIDFYGFVWDVIDEPEKDMLLVVQLFKAEGVMGFPDGSWYMFSPLFGQWTPFSVTSQYNLGDIYELGATWMHKIDVPAVGLKGVDYFASVGVSITDPDTYGYMGMPLNHDGDMLYMYYTLLGGPYLTLGHNFNPLYTPNQATARWDDLGTKAGWAVYLGTRIPITRFNAKLGLEYNYGSKWWLPFMVGSDDIYFNKLATRGHVGEIYWIQDLPVGEALNKYAKASLRIGFQYFWFNYTGSGLWLGKPKQIDSDIQKDIQSFNQMISNFSSYLAGGPVPTSMLEISQATMFMPIDHMYNLYVSFELNF